MPASSAARISPAVCDAGEYDLAWITRQPARGRVRAGDDVETGAERANRLRDRQAGIGLDRVADQVGRFGKGVAVGLVGTFERLRE